MLNQFYRTWLSKNMKEEEIDKVDPLFVYRVKRWEDEIKLLFNRQDEIEEEQTLC